MTVIRKGIVSFLLMCFAASSASADTAAESSVKAAIVHKISKFVDWPEHAFASEESPIRFCVVGDSQILDALRKLRDRPIHGRLVDASSAPPPAEVAAACDVLYLGSDAERDAQEWINEVAGKPILTFGETGGYGAKYSIVSVMVRRDKVRFEINLEASDDTGLRIGAQLLQLAAAVGGRGA